MSNFITLDKDVKYEYIVVLWQKTKSGWVILQNSMPYSTLQLSFNMAIDAVKRAETQIGGEFCFTIQWRAIK